MLKMKSDSLNTLFCCNAFETRIRNAGKSGVSILARSNENKRFLIQSRGVDDDLSVIALECPIKINIASEIIIRYCPFCGFKLGVWIDKHAAYFELLAKDHLSLVLSK